MSILVRALLGATRAWAKGVAVAAITALIALTGLPASAAEAGASLAAPPALSASAPADAAGVADSAVTLMVFNRPIVRFLASLPGVPPADRARRASAEVSRILRAGGPGVVSFEQQPSGTFVLIDDIGVFPLLPGDLREGQTVKGVVRALEAAVQESREASSLRLMLTATGFALLATLFAGLLIWLLHRLRLWLRQRLVALGQRHRDRLAVGGKSLLSGDRIFRLARAFTAGVYFVLVLIVAAEWVGFVLLRFPYTRRWGEELHQSSFELAGKFATAILGALPGLAVALLILFLARAAVGLTTPFFAQVERGELSLSWLDRYTVRATRGLVHIGIWLFALAMAYPYLPGSDTEAFKGMTVLLGVMLSLGSSNFVGQGVSGLILTYSRTLHVGEYVRIAEFEGTVTEVGTFATRVRTGLGEELTLPNTLIVGAVTKNYSRVTKGVGYIVDTVMTIGYDTPWRQVHAMMIEGAKRTEGVLATPSPHVFQTALSDFYVEYRLVAQAIASQPRPRAQVMADLHANLQDVFNENGVQIMSPHYFADPATAKLVPPAMANPPLTGRG